MNETPATHATSADCDGHEPMLSRRDVVAELPAHPDDLRAAGVMFCQAMLGCDAGRLGWLVEANWACKLAARAQRIAELHAQRQRQQAEQGEREIAAAARRKERRSAAAQRAARTRREKKILSATPYGRLLLALREAQARNDSAKLRAANGRRFCDYYDGSRYARSNYRRSREARANDYWNKWLAIQTACHEAEECSITWGWGEDPDVAQAPHVLYFDLPTGQVSFHSSVRALGPDYAGEWDGVPDMADARIEAAISQAIEGANPSWPRR